MAYATQSTEARVLRFLSAQDTTSMFLAALAELRGIRGCSQSRLTAMQRGKAFEHQAYVEMGELISQLESLCERLKPVPIRFRDAQQINDLLHAVRSGQVSILNIEGGQNESNS